MNWFQIMFLFLVRQQCSHRLKSWNCCELISNYVLIFGSTTGYLIISCRSRLWIDFKLCSYFWFDNINKNYTAQHAVVNWFQIMFLFLVRQRQFVQSLQLSRCELISNYVLIFGSTTSTFIGPHMPLLWIDFKLCSYFWFDNNIIGISRLMQVVNWFQIMFLFLVRQQSFFNSPACNSCELISNYVLIFGSTTTWFL